MMRAACDARVKRARQRAGARARIDDAKA